MLPQVAIVGRPNVGKSSLLNMLAGRRISIVDPTAGVTRDRVTTEIELPPLVKGEGPRWCELMDTGGFGLYGEDDDFAPLTGDVERQITIALQESDLVMFVVDVSSGITPLDERVAQLIRETLIGKKKVLLVANKCDSEKHEADAYGMLALGFEDMIPVSATTGYNKIELVEGIAERIDWASVNDREEPHSEMQMAIVGRRNAGKSTLVNALAGQERVIASELAGTTRDSIDVRFKIGDKQFTAIDTAGVRKRKSMKDDVEYYSYHRALKSIRRADVVVLMLDATQDVSHVDKKLSSEIAEHYKPCVIVLNKWDLVEGKLEPEQFLEYLSEQLRGLDFAPIVCTAAVNDDHVHEVVETAMLLFEQAGVRHGTGALNRVMRDIVEQRGPSSKKGRRARIYYVTQVEVHPPTIVLFVNDPDLFDPNYRRYIMNQLRNREIFEEVPLRLWIRSRSRKEEGEEEDLIEI